MEWLTLGPDSAFTAEILQLFGITGFLLYFGGFAGLQTGYLDGNGLTYTLCSVTAATFVLISLIGAFNLASLLIQVSWICIGLFGIWRRFRRRPQSVVFKSKNKQQNASFRPKANAVFAQPDPRTHAPMPHQTHGA